MFISKGVSTHGPYVKKTSDFLVAPPGHTNIDNSFEMIVGIYYNSEEFLL